jgi:hypothetical protein
VDETGQEVKIGEGDFARSQMKHIFFLLFNQ